MANRRQTPAQGIAVPVVVEGQRIFEKVAPLFGIPPEVVTRVVETQQSGGMSQLWDAWAAASKPTGGKES